MYHCACGTPVRMGIPGLTNDHESLNMYHDHRNQSRDDHGATVRFKRNFWLAKFLTSRCWTDLRFFQS